MADKAEVRCSCGRWHLAVFGIVIAMEGDPCRDGELPEPLYDPIPAAELASCCIGDKRANELPIKVVRFFRGAQWNEAMLRYVAEVINRS